MYPPVLSICFRSFRFFAVVLLLLGAVKEGHGQGPTRTYLAGQKTGNHIPSAFISLGPGSAGLTAPMIEHRNGGLLPPYTFRFYYGPTYILNGSTTHFTRLRAAQDVGLLGILGAGANAYLTIRNTNNASLISGATTYFNIRQRPSVEGISIAVGGLLGLVELQNIKGRGYTGATDYNTVGNGLINEGSPSGTESGTKTQFLVDNNGEWYIAVTPDGNYNSVRLEVKLPDDLRVADVARSINVNIYNAFIESQGDACSTMGRYTSPGEATGINLNTGIIGGIELNQLIANPHYVLNNNPDQYASYSSGVASVGVANTVSQTIYFDHSASGSDGVNVRLGLSNSLIGLDLIALNGITFTAYNGSNDTPVWQSGLGDLAQLLGLDLLNLINIGGSHRELNITFKPEASFDRIKLELNKGLLGIDVIGDALRVYHVKLAPAAPEILSPVDQPTDVNICEHETATFSVTASVPTGSITQYEWQYFNGITWIIAEGVNNQREYSINNTPLEYNNRIYRAAVTGGISGCEQTVYSNEALLTVRPQPGRPQLSITSPSN